MARAIVNVANGNIGDIRHSMLTLAQFQTANGTGWVLMDGSSCAGTTYASITGNSTLPDARGLFLRAAGTNGSALNGKTPTATLGTRQGDATAKNGLYDAGHNHLQDASGGGGAVHGVLIGSVLTTLNWDSGIKNGTAALASTDTETRPANLAVNIFIKVN